MAGPKVLAGFKDPPVTAPPTITPRSMAKPMQRPPKVLEALLSIAVEKKVRTRKTSLKFTEYKFMPIKLESPTATVIYGNKVVLQSWTKEPFAVMIENEEMAENQKRYFKELWKIGTK